MINKENKQTFYIGLVVAILLMLVNIVSDLIAQKVIYNIIILLLAIAFIIQLRAMYVKIDQVSRAKKLNYYQIFAKSINPIIVHDDNGTIIDYNAAFVKRFGRSKKLNDIGINDDDNDKKTTKLVYNSRTYALTHYQNTIQFNDLTKSQREYTRLKKYDMIPCYVFIDSFNDAVGELTGVERNQILGETQNAILSYFRTNNINIELISYDRMLAVMNHKDYEAIDIKSNRLNKQIRKIGNSYNVDLSISLGIDLTRTRFTYERFDEAKEAAQIAQRRGGNQIVIKRNGTYNYIGGNNNPIEKSTDFVAKNFAKRISSFIEESENIYIFAHEFPDMDAFASGLIMAKIIQMYEKNVKFVMDIQNASYDVKRALKTLSPEDTNILTDRVDMRQVKNGINLAIVVDVNNPRNIFDFEHFNKFNRKIVIDHHIQKEDTVKASVEYIEVASSSVIEMIVEMMDYFKYELRMSPYQATYALAALMVDTKNYQVKTTSKTFAIASLLRRKGARIDIANEWINDDLKYMKYINERVNEAKLYLNKVAIVEINNFTDRAIVSKISDRLITSNEVEAGFVLNNYRGALTISARSKGKINVEQIMAHFNGGGHATMAATKIQIGRKSNAEIIKQIVELSTKQMEE